MANGRPIARAWKEYLAEDLKTGEIVVLRIPADPEKTFQELMAYLHSKPRRR